MESSKMKFGKAERRRLFADAQEIVSRINDLVIGFDAAGAFEALEQYDRVVAMLNGGSLLGSRAGPRASGTLVDSFCAARPGKVPGWGQRGQFLIELEGLLARVIFQRVSSDRHSVEFFAVDPNEQFLSVSGYRCEFIGFEFGRSVAQTVDALFRKLLEDGLVDLSADRVVGMKNEPRPRWLRGAVGKQKESRSRRVPAGYVIVDAVLPSHQAFIVRKWAADAEAKLNMMKVRDKKPRIKP